MTPSRRGITLFQVLVAIVMIFVLLVVAFIIVTERFHANYLRNGDTVRLRGIAQSLNAFAYDSNGEYPIPSSLDRNDATISATDPGHKNTSGALISILIYHNSIVPETAFGQLEQGPVRLAVDYEYSNPSGTNDPMTALWDPRFKGTPKDTIPGPPKAHGNLSYAHAPLDAMRAFDATTPTATTPLVSARGPLYEPDPNAAGTFRPSRASSVHGTDSVTLDMYGKRGDWHGPVAFLDAHVEWTGPTFASGDHLFIRATPTDAYLRQYWRGIPMNTSPDPTFNPYAEPNGPHVYIDGDR